MMKPKFIILTTVPDSLIFFKGQIRKLKEKFKVHIISSPGQKLNDFSQSEQVSFDEIDMERKISVFKDIKSLYKLTRLFNKLKPNIIHGNTPKAGLLSMISGWINRIPVRIYYIHGLRFEGVTGLKKKILIITEKLACFFSTDIIAVSYGVKDSLRKNKITKKEIKVIHNGSINGIDPEYYSSKSNIPNLRNQYNFDTSHTIFGYVGRIVKDKGIDELIFAFKNLHKKYPQIRLLIVGNFEDDLDPINETSKKEIETNPNIIFVGYQKDIRPFLKMTDVFVFPSYREGFGISLIEASAMSVPSITTNITGCNEIINNNVNGFLVPPKSRKHLMIQMEKFVLNPSLINKMGKVAREMVIKRYNQKEVWEETNNTYFEIYKESL